MAHEQSSLQLPQSVVSVADVARLLRELEAVADFLTQAKIRTPGTSLALPRLSRTLEELIGDNGLSLLKPDQAQIAKDFLLNLRKQSPLVHISFAVEPPVSVVVKILSWLRTEIHPTVLLQIGLQPKIGAGFILRTANKSFDCSLRKNLTAKHDLLLDSISQKSSGVA